MLHNEPKAFYRDLVRVSALPSISELLGIAMNHLHVSKAACLYQCRSLFCCHWKHRTKMMGASVALFPIFACHIVDVAHANSTLLSFIGGAKHRKKGDDHNCKRSSIYWTQENHRLYIVQAVWFDISFIVDRNIMMRMQVYKLNDLSHG